MCLLTSTTLSEVQYLPKHMWSFFFSFFFFSDKCGAQFCFPYIQGEIGKIKDIYVYGTGLTICDTKLGNIHVHLMLQI